ncbi:MAG: ABC transporter ATP-binding protein [Janthinobacterium lividum]
MTYAIKTHDLVKTYTAGKPFLGRKTNAVDGLALNVPEGSIYGLLGRNSAGKTTTLRMAMGLARPSSGSMEVFGLNPAADPSRVEVLRQVGYVPEDKFLAGALTARKLFELNRSFYPDTWSDAFARRLCERLELPLDTLYAKLSLGNKTKSALIAAMAQRSRLLILDEPTTGLDPVVLDELLRILVEDCTADGRTIFLSTHQLPEIEQIADYIGIMDRGKLLLEGRLDDIRASFRRVSVVGAALPEFGPGILSRRQESHATQYVLRDGLEVFEQRLRSNGATIVDSKPLSLTDIFLELCRTSEAEQDSRTGAAA